MVSTSMQAYPGPALIPGPEPPRNGFSGNPDDSDSDISTSMTDHDTPASGLEFLGTAGLRHGSGDRPAQPESTSAIKERLAELEIIDDKLAIEGNKRDEKRRQKDQHRRERYATEDATVTARRIAEDINIKDRRIAEDAAIKDRRDAEDAPKFTLRSEKEERIRKRREREDAEIIDWTKAVEDEEQELRRKLKNAKRARPIDEGGAPKQSEGPAASPLSPRAPKRHQPSPISAEELQSPVNIVASSGTQPMTFMHPLPQGLPPPSQPQMQTSAYPTWAPNPRPPPGAFAYSPGGTFQPPMQPQAPTGPPPRFLPSAPPIKYGPSPQPPSSTPAPQVPVPQSSATHYDVNPPAGPAPPMQSSGFQSINQPPSNTVSTPPVVKGKGKSRNSGLDTAVHHTPSHPPGTSVTPPSTAGGKRKASTTHPYSQSEAFANRHHHCERTDALDRGVWTYFGPGGTKDNPTIPNKKEMHLKCHHNNCNRIDWKTVHGLQCHIVKHHGVPKGTIGSLDLALEAYGVDVKEIEDYEKVHGLGSGGVIVEKSASRKPRNRQSNGTSSSTAQTTPAAPVAPTYQPPKSTLAPAPTSRPVPPPPSLHFHPSVSKSVNGGYLQEDFVYSEDESDGDKQSPSPKSRPSNGTAYSIESSKPSKTEVQESISPVKKAAEMAAIPLSSVKDRSASPNTRDPFLEKPVAAKEDQSANGTTSAAPSRLDIPQAPQSQPNSPVAEATSMKADSENRAFSDSPVKSETTSQIVTFKFGGKKLQHLAESGLSASGNSSLSPSVDPTPPPAKPSSTPTSLSRPHNKNHRIPASKRWDWAPVVSASGSEDDQSMPSGQRRKDRTISAPSLAEARDELQGHGDDSDDISEFRDRELRDRSMMGPRSAGLTGAGVRYSERAAKKPRKRYHYED